MEMSGVSTSSTTAVRGKARGLLYIGKKGREMKKIAGWRGGGISGFTNE